MKEMENSNEFDFTTSIAKRMDTLLARKRAENALTIARIATLDTSWKEVNGEIDKELKVELETARVEAQAVRDAKERLKRTVCGGVDKKAYAIVGKVVDVESKTGLPGLMVKIAVALQEAEQAFEAQTDNYGDFFFSFTPDPAAVARVKQISLLIIVLLDTDTVVHREQRAIEPQAGEIEHLTIAVKCSGRLKDVLEHGKQVAESVEGDAALVESRAANLNDAYTAFRGLSDTTLLRMRRLKEELSVNPPTLPSTRVAVETAAVGEVVKTRYLGNASTRELHDLKNATPRCQVDEIKPEHRVAFKTEKEALAAGYDYCAYCFGKEKSKR